VPQPPIASDFTLVVLIRSAIHRALGNRSLDPGAVPRTRATLRKLGFGLFYPTFGLCRPVSCLPLNLNRPGLFLSDGKSQGESIELGPMNYRIHLPNENIRNVRNFALFRIFSEKKRSRRRFQNLKVCPNKRRGYYLVRKSLNPFVDNREGI
jgi:hypothetical protein